MWFVDEIQNFTHLLKLSKRSGEIIKFLDNIEIDCHTTDIQIHSQCGSRKDNKALFKPTH